jgi:hypothetical protein
MLTPIYVLTFAIYYMYVTGMLTSDRKFIRIVNVGILHGGPGRAIIRFLGHREISGAACVGRLALTLTLYFNIAHRQKAMELGSDSRHGWFCVCIIADDWL